MSDDDVDKKIRQLSDVRKLMFTSIMTALALVVGLFWNEAIKATIEQIVPQGDSLFYKYVAAIIVTVIVVFFIYILVHGQRVAEKRIARLQKELSSKGRKRKGILRLR